MDFLTHLTFFHPMQVSGGVGKVGTLYRPASYQVDVAALREEVAGKLVWLAKDEWTDSLGHAIINILVGCSGKIFVAGTT